MKRHRAAVWMVGAFLAIVFVGLTVLLWGLERTSVIAEPGPEDGPVDAVLDRLTVIHGSGHRLYAVEDHFLYVSTDTGQTFQRLGLLPKSHDLSFTEKVRELVARNPVVRSLRRDAGPKSMAVLGSGTLIVFYDRIYRSVDEGMTFTPLPGTSPRNIPPPFPYAVGAGVGPGDTVYYGEYSTHHRPNAVRIVRGTDDGTRWEVVYTFPKGAIFHVHSVTYDPYRDRFWVTTGDVESEARLMYTDDGFRTIHTAGCCDQRWRVVDLIVTQDALIWGSDDDRHDPGIYRFEPDTGRLIRVFDLPNPSYAAALLDDGTMAIATTYEPRSALSANGAPATTSVYLSEDGGWSWNRALSLQAQAEAKGGGKRPRFDLPTGDPLPALFATPWFTEQWDFVALKIDTP